MEPLGEPDAGDKLGRTAAGTARKARYTTTTATIVKQTAKMAWPGEVACRFLGIVSNMVSPDYRRFNAPGPSLSGTVREMSGQSAPTGPRILTWLRARVERWPAGRTVWRVGIAVLGGLIIVVGVVLLPLPGPGWLIIFLGLGLWSTEFAWAARLLHYAKLQVGRWTAWLRRKPRWSQLLIGAVLLACTAAAVIGCWYLLR